MPRASFLARVIQGWRSMETGRESFRVWCGEGSVQQSEFQACHHLWITPGGVIATKLVVGYSGVEGKVMLIPNPTNAQLVGFPDYVGGIPGLQHYRRVAS